ncbi:ParA family protein [Fusobacterium sp.]|uniref:ParA family protein n=1 Tax=Fusobacterium sp. TaxID=68766 RepID=UPI0029020907|nr:ParA family protein [Fusobacterium sp.]MDU1912683.1 ParA family protein [Fusobacterium sp.]
MEKKLNISLALKKDGRISQARISLSSDVIEHLKITENERKIKIIYEKEKIQIQKIETKSEFEEIIVKEENKLKKFQTSKNLALEGSGDKGTGKTYYNWKLFIPLPIINDWKITKENREVILSKEIDNKIIIKQYDTREKDMEKKENQISLDTKNKVEIKNGIIFDVKNNKGGVGKTEIAKELGHGFSLLGNKVLIISTDAQNNIIDDLYPEEFIVKKGLKEDVFYGTGEMLRLRENLYYMPLKEYKFSDKFLKAIPEYLDKKRKEFDVIIIDSPPLLEVDKVFVECADKIIIPTFCDRKTIKGVLNLINSDKTVLEKINAIVINRYEDTKVQKEWKNALLEALNGTKILCSTIPKLSFIEQMINNQKTIWEYSNQQALEIQKTYTELLFNLMK